MADNKKKDIKAGMRDLANDVAVGELATRLSKDIPQESIKTRSQGGREFAYVPGYYVKQTANEVFGPLGWEHEMLPEYKEHIKIGKTSDGKAIGLWTCPVRTTVTYKGHTKTTVELGTTMYYGKTQMEMGLKGCITDGLKRGLHVLGKRFGLNLYDVDADEATAQSVTAEDAPDCPKCGSPMRLRSGKKGQFWGCSKYPNCNGTRDVGDADDNATNGPSADSVKGDDDGIEDDLPF